MSFLLPSDEFEGFVGVAGRLDVIERVGNPVLFLSTDRKSAYILVNNEIMCGNLYHTIGELTGCICGRYS